MSQMDAEETEPESHTASDQDPGDEAQTEGDDDEGQVFQLQGTSTDRGPRRK